MRLRLAAGVSAAALALALLALTVEIGGAPDERPVAGPAPTAPGSLDSGRAVYARMGCGSCHALAAAGSQGTIGPDLDQRLPAHSRATLVARITESPSKDDQTFSVMPQNFGSRLDADALNALVDFLLAAREG